MTKTKKTVTEGSHTPGPWTSRELLNNVEGTSSHVIVWRDGTKDSHQYRRVDRAGHLSRRDARLIAAAPELLEALKMVMGMDVNGHALQDRLQFSTPGRAILEKASAAIAKAQS